MRGLPPAAWAYVSGVVAIATILVTTSLILGPGSPTLDWGALGILAALFLVCDAAPAALNIERARVSPAYAASLASVVLLGPVGAALVGAAAVVTAQRHLTLEKRLFNGAQFALCGYAAGQIYLLFGGMPDARLKADMASEMLAPFVAADVTFVLVNLLLVGGILGVTRQMRVHGARWAPIITLGLTCLGYGMFGLLIAGLWNDVGPYVAVLVLLPLFIARWAFAQSKAQQEAYDATIATLCQAVETKDYYTRGHSERVSRGSVMIAEEIGMGPERLTAIRYAGMLHDVGKLGVPTKVLQKPGKLSEEEYAAVQLHPMRGLEIVKEIGFLDEALAGIMHHHERVDGTGYPMGLAGDEIPEFARVISVADVFDTLTSTRSYRKAWSLERATAELRRSAGAHFDPDMVEAFLRALDRVGWDPPEPVDPPADGSAQTTQQDHDDPTQPLRVAGG